MGVCVDRCVKVHAMRRVDRCVDMCADIGVDMYTGMCAHRCVDKCGDIYVNVHVHMCTSSAFADAMTAAAADATPCAHMRVCCVRCMRGQVGGLVDACVCVCM